MNGWVGNTPLFRTGKHITKYAEIGSKIDVFSLPVICDVNCVVICWGQQNDLTYKFITRNMSYKYAKWRRAYGMWLTFKLVCIKKFPHLVLLHFTFKISHKTSTYMFCRIDLIYIWISFLSFSMGRM